MQSIENIATEASLVAVDGEPLVIGVGTELTAEDGVMWASSMEGEVVTVGVETPFRLGSVRVTDGATFSVDELTSLLERGHIEITGVRGPTRE